MLALYLEVFPGAQTDITCENVSVFESVQPPREEEEEEKEPSNNSYPSSSHPLNEGTVLSLPAGSQVLDTICVMEKWPSTLESSGQLCDE